MESLNFVKTLSSADHKAIARWYVITRLACVITCIIIFMVQTYQWYNLYSLYHLKKQIIQTPSCEQVNLLDEQQHLQLQISRLKKQKEALLALTTNRTKNLDLIQSITDPLAYGCSIESCTITKTALSMVVHTPTMNALSRCIEQLSQQKGLKGLRLLSLQTHQKHLIASLETSF